MTRKRKIVMMLVALLGAVVLWLYVVTVVAPEANTRVSSIPINIDGTIVLEERGLMITDQDVTTLSLELSTSRVNLNKLNADSIRVNADASRIREPGEYALTCTVTFPDTVRTSDVDLIRKSVETVNVTVTRLETKPVKVDLVWTGTVREGFLVDTENVLIEPAEILVYGPDFDVSQVSRAVVYYDVSDREETVVETLPVVFLNENDEEIAFSSEATSVNASQVSMTLPVYRTKDLTLKINTKEGGGVTNENAEITIVPDTIRVQGAAELIDQLEDELILDEVDLSTAEEEQELTYELSLPVGVTNVSGEAEAKVTIRIVGVTTDTVPISDIRLIHEPEGLHAEATTRTVWLTVRGDVDEINELKENPYGIYVVVDLKDHSQIASFTAEGKVVNISHPSLSFPESVDISVSISEAEPETGGDEG